MQRAGKTNAQTHILLVYMCLHTTRMYVSKCRVYMCPHTEVYMCPSTAYYAYMCVLILILNSMVRA
jgi:hypothetical protein